MSLRALVKRSVALTCFYYLVDDWRARRRLARGDLATTSGARHATLSLDASLDYIDRIHADYLAYGGIARFSGVVAEIGPGDNFGVALRMLGDGATAVHAIDRYRPRRDAAQQAQIYQALAARHGLTDLFDGGANEAAVRGLVQHAGVPAETFFRDSGIQFDAIVSRAVLEHLYDPLGALDDMAAALTPGGVLIHRIDLRDHGMFAGHHPLTFLTASDGLHRAMTRGAGRPNRVLVSAYRAWLERSGLDGAITVSRLTGMPDQVDPAPWDALPPGHREAAVTTVRAIRPRLAPAFRAMTDEDLAVSGCVLVARRPA
jgi:SAM-dependent methyltransferase